MLSTGPPRDMLDRFDAELGWMYQTTHTNGEPARHRVHGLVRGLHVPSVRLVRSCSTTSPTTTRLAGSRSHSAVRARLRGRAGQGSSRAQEDDVRHPLVTRSSELSSGPCVQLSVWRGSVREGARSGRLRRARKDSTPAAGGPSPEPRPSVDAHVPRVAPWAEGASPRSTISGAIERCTPWLGSGARRATSRTL